MTQKSLYTPASSAVLKVKATRLNIANAESVKADGLGMIRSGARYLVVDLSSVDFIDSSGLGALVAMHKEIGADGAVSLKGVGDFVARVLTLTSMDGVFNIQD